MSETRPATDDVLMSWMRLEVSKINEGIVTERKSLAQLLIEERPASKTKAGEDHLFDKDTLQFFRENLPGELHYKLKLPVLFFNSMNVPDSCYLNDESALLALQVLGDLSKLRRMQRGKIWVGRSIAYSIMKKYPTAVQIVMA
ncbi:DUF61 family protein [Methanolobus halotolerans]|uniref:DUF61 domain-containing protein n=1 Tax=Methanolobus halotolerans TaxID=2052935 RepID=A0A4E0Q553_9EURY|nr:DUF61 family protein [Methanolobus halotolerans]TGC08981.1 DUF61 domain-containing protein [Methanolobus halotolerans]